jgi:hypothetical protein
MTQGSATSLSDLDGSLVSIARKTGKRLPRYRDESGEAVA